MSVETYYLMRRTAPQHAALPELSVVEILQDVRTDDGVTVPVGSQGTIVATWGEGEAYEVEFAEPVVGLATVGRDLLRSAQSHAVGGDIGASAKIAGYLLDVTHAKGGPKARFFLSFGFAVDRPEVLVASLFRHVCDDHLIRSEPGVHGVKYIFEGSLTTPDRRNPKVRSIQQVKASEKDLLDFVTAYPIA